MSVSRINKGLQINSDPLQAISLEGYSSWIQFQHRLENR